MISNFGPIFEGFTYLWRTVKWVSSKKCHLYTFHHALPNRSTPILIEATVQEMLRKNHLHAWQCRRHHPATSLHNFTSFHPFQHPVIFLEPPEKHASVCKRSFPKLIVDIIKFTSASALLPFGTLLVFFHLQHPSL